MVESWFIPTDLFMIVCSTLCIISATFQLLMMILDKTLHTVPMMLFANSHLCASMIACCTLSLAIFMFENDFKQIEYQDAFCIMRIYLTYVMIAVFNYSFVLQGLYRYLIVIYPTRLLFQSFRFQILMICLTWLFSFVYSLLILFNHQFIYNVDNQICELPSSFILTMMYCFNCIYAIPLSLLIFLYWRLIRHVRQMGRNLAAANILARAKRELKMVKRTVIVILIVASICLPYVIMTFLEFSNHKPKYKYRIGYIFVDALALIAVIVSFQFNDSLKESVMRKIKWPLNRITSQNIHHIT